MSQATSGNVVPLSQHPKAQARLSPRESADVLTGCRDLALERITVALSGMLDKVEDELFELAEKTTDRASQNVFLDARAKARGKRKVIETSFRQYFVEMFNRKVRGEPASIAVMGGGELALVGEDELEESLALENMARKMRSACEAELSALGQRMGFLLERPLEDDANPMSPGTVVAALQSACAQIEADFKVRLALLRQLEQHAIEDLQRVYQELNRHLVERQILPEIRPAAPRAQPSAERPKPKNAPAANPTAPAAVSEADVFRVLSQILGQAGGGAGTVAAPAAAAAPKAFLAELTRMHRGGSPMITAADEILVNVVKGLKAAPQGATLGSIDAMTIDIVAMLFDYIFDDRHIPASVKAVLGRLQIPILKVALLDKSFFSSKAHPARRLLDRLSEAAFGVDEAYPQGGATLALIEKVVARVLEEFESDMHLFEELVGEVELFIDERGRAESQLVERTVRLIQDREREEIAQLAAEDAVARHLQSRAWVPAVLRDMLNDTWVRALAKAHAADGERSPRWQALVTTMDDLLWSVEPKVVADDRKRLVTMLPGMLKQVQDALTRGEMRDEKRDVFLASLVDCHAAAVKAGLRGMGIIPENAPAPVEPLGSPELAHSVVPAGDLRVEEIRLRSPRGAPVRNVFTRTGVWSNLQRGTWVEFVGSASGLARVRARLTWISPAKGVYLFTNPLSASNAVSISPDALAEQLRLGLARIIDDAPLLDRAVDSMLAKLRPEPA
jgi:hypothetical protein